MIFNRKKKLFLKFFCNNLVMFIAILIVSLFFVFFFFPVFFLPHFVAFFLFFLCELKSILDKILFCLISFYCL